MTAIVLTGLAGIIIYAVIKTLWVFCPRLLIRWADYFGVQIEEKEPAPSANGTSPDNNNSVSNDNIKLKKMSRGN